MLGRRVICPSKPAYYIADCWISKHRAHSRQWTRTCQNAYLCNALLASQGRQQGSLYYTFGRRAKEGLALEYSVAIGFLLSTKDITVLCREYVLCGHIALSALRS